MSGMLEMRQGGAAIAPLPNADRKAVVVFATTACVSRRYGDGPMVLDMAGADLSLLNSGCAPFLEDHFSTISSMIGVIEHAWISGERGFAEVRFARTPNGEAAWLLVQDGIAKNCSVGFSYTKSDAERLEDTDALVCRRWQPHEISLVPMPADWKCSVLPADMGEEDTRRWKEAEAAAARFRGSKARLYGKQTDLEAFALAAAPALALAIGGNVDLTERTLIAEVARHVWG